MPIKGTCQVLVDQDEHCGSEIPCGKHWLSGHTDLDKNIADIVTDSLLADGDFWFGSFVRSDLQQLVLERMKRRTK
jgi:hypothetical protein